jgi:multicomponent K+:H+ antiporter subunit G
MGTTLGLGFTLIASMLLFSALESRPVLHEIVIAVFMIVTTPVTFMLLVRAALHRDRGERDDARRRTPGNP